MKKLKILKKQKIDKVECDFLKSLDHENIIKYFDMFESNDNFLCIIMENPELGNITNILEILQMEEFDEDTFKYITS